LAAVAGPSIVIVTAGGGTVELVAGTPEPFTTGQVIFVPANGRPPLTASDADLVVHVAFAEAD
jgi:quercetin dioxygenase-like cupin family protein